MHTAKKIKQCKYWADALTLAEPVVFYRLFVERRRANAIG